MTRRHIAEDQSPSVNLSNLQGHWQCRAAEVLASGRSHFVAAATATTSPCGGRLHVLHVPAYYSSQFLSLQQDWDSSAGIVTRLQAGSTVPSPRVPGTPSFLSLETRWQRREADRSLPFPDMPSYNLGPLQLEFTDHPTTCHPQTTLQSFGCLDVSFVA